MTAIHNSLDATILHPGGNPDIARWFALMAVALVVSLTLFSVPVEQLGAIETSHQIGRQWSAVAAT